ncbi:STAS domain-containing protein [Streptomyces sp. LARHCF249]
MTEPTAPARAAVTWHGRRAIVIAGGEIDYDTAPLLRDALDEALSDSVRRVDVDFADVSFCDCSGLRVLLWADRRARWDGRSLRLVNVTAPVVRHLLHATRTTRLLDGGTGDGARPADQAAASPE